MKSLVRSYLCWPGMDKKIEDVVKLCRCCAMTAKAPSVKINPGPKTDDSQIYILTMSDQ